MPGARNRFPASAARQEEGAATEELPLAAPRGAQVGGGRGLGRSRIPGLRVGAGVGFEGGVGEGRGGLRGSGLGCGWVNGVRVRI